MLIIFLLVSTMPIHVMNLFSIGKLRYTSNLRLQGMSVLTVDIFVSYYHHPITLLLDTLRAVVSIDYPSDSFRVILLDSSNSQEIKDHVQGLGIDNVYYTAQEVPSQTLSKTTKLTHGLQFVESLPGGTSQLMAVLDVGAIPSPLWLRELIPFILEDETVAMASTPKHPYDIPDGDVSTTPCLPCLLWSVSSEPQHVWERKAYLKVFDRNLEAAKLTPIPTLAIEAEYRKCL